MTTKSVKYFKELICIIVIGLFTFVLMYILSDSITSLTYSTLIPLNHLSINPLIKNFLIDLVIWSGPILGEAISAFIGGILIGLFISKRQKMYGVLLITCIYLFLFYIELTRAPNKTLLIMLAVGLIISISTNMLGIALINAMKETTGVRNRK